MSAPMVKIDLGGKSGLLWLVLVPLVPPAAAQSGGRYDLARQSGLPAAGRRTQKCPLGGTLSLLGG